MVEKDAVLEIADPCMHPRQTIKSGDQADLEETDPVAAAMESEDAEVFIVRITEEQARAFARRAVALVASGRPIDADGHICPRANGYRRHLPE